jgi:hypothetical protein
MRNLCLVSLAQSVIVVPKRLVTAPETAGTIGRNSRIPSVELIKSDESGISNRGTRVSSLRSVPSDTVSGLASLYWSRRGRSRVSHRCWYRRDARGDR